MKKFFSLTLTLAATLSAMAVSAQAADYSFETILRRLRLQAAARFLLVNPDC